MSYLTRRVITVLAQNEPRNRSQERRVVQEVILAEKLLFTKA